MHQPIRQFRLIQRRINIGRHDNGGDTTSYSRREFGFDTVEAGAEIDQAGADDAAGGIDGLLGREASGCFTDTGDLAVGNKKGSVTVDAVFRVNYSV